MPVGSGTGALYRGAPPAINASRARSTSSGHTAQRRLWRELRGRRPQGRMMPNYGASRSVPRARPAGRTSSASSAAAGSWSTTLRAATGLDGHQAERVGDHVVELARDPRRSAATRARVPSTLAIEPAVFSAAPRSGACGGDRAAREPSDEASDAGASMSDGAPAEPSTAQTANSDGADGESRIAGRSPPRGGRPRRHATR